MLNIETEIIRTFTWGWRLEEGGAVLSKQGNKNCLKQITILIKIEWGKFIDGKAWDDIFLHIRAEGWCKKSLTMNEKLKRLIKLKSI